MTLFWLMLIPVILLLGCQSKIIYHPQPYHEGNKRTLEQHGGVALEYVTGEGRQVAHYVSARGGSTGSIWMCFAGNGSRALDWLAFRNDWDASFGYLMIDYPSYGDCSGKPKPESIRESSLAAVEALARHLKLTAEMLRPRLAVLGHSLGCAAGLMAAEDQGVKKVVLISPFTTMTEMGQRVLGWPLCYLNLHRFDNRKSLAAVVQKGAVVAIFHGTADEVIPISMARELAAAHPSAVTLHEEAGQDHNVILGNCSAKIHAAMTAD